MGKLGSQYKESVKQLIGYLNTSLENVKREKECLIKNYDITKEKNEEIKEKLTVDIRAIEELMSQVRIVYKSTSNNFGATMLYLF